MGAEFDTAMGHQIRLTREYKEMSLLDLVSATGIPQSDLEAYEAGARIPPSRIDPIASALRIKGPGLVQLALLRSEPRGTVSAASSEEGIQLMEYFVCITDRRLRAALIDAAHSLADPEASLGRRIDD